MKCGDPNCLMQENGTCLRGCEVAPDIDYSNHPLSVTELRSDRTGKAHDWTVRDALISALRDLDSGELKAECCVLVFGHYSGDGTTHTRFYQRTENRYEHVGLLEDHKRRLAVRDATGDY